MAKQPRQSTALLAATISLMRSLVVALRHALFVG
jgi:hypothetical protein